MTGIFPWFAIGLNLGAATVQVVLARRYFRRLQELSNGHRQSSASLGSGTGAVQAPAHRERTGGTEPPAAASPGPEPVAQEILAWRSWVLMMEQGAFLDCEPYLASWRGTKWEGPTLVADRMPEPNNESGVYSRCVDWHPSPFVLTPLSEPRVRGTVALSGRVIQGEQGYRAERATIRELWLYDTGNALDLTLKDTLEARYQCPVHVNDPPPFDGWIYL